MIVAVITTPTPLVDLTVELKVSVQPGYVVRVGGSLQGMDAMRVEYKKNGASGWSNAAFLTKLPADVTITPATPGQPESGHIRAILIRKNEDVGNFSPEYPVTVS